MQRKRIKVLTKGNIHALGGACGPLDYPFMESLDKIFSMLRDGVRVVEILDDGREVPLSIINFDKDNTESEEAVEYELAPEPKAVPVEQSPLETAPGEKEDRKAKDNKQPKEHKAQNNQKQAPKDALVPEEETMEKK